MTMCDVGGHHYVLSVISITTQILTQSSPEHTVTYPGSARDSFHRVQEIFTTSQILWGNLTDILHPPLDHSPWNLSRVGMKSFSTSQPSSNLINTFQSSSKKYFRAPRTWSHYLWTGNWSRKRRFFRCFLVDIFNNSAIKGTVQWY